MPTLNLPNLRGSSSRRLRLALVCVSLSWFHSLSPSIAEVTCASTISYNWAKDSESSHTNEVHSVVLSHGSSEDEAKAELSIKTRRAQAAALVACRQEHETVSSCVSKRFRQAGDVLKNGSLATRRALETSISTECSQGIGRCVSIDVGQPECRTVATVPPPEPSVEPVAPSGKGAAGGKK